MIKKYILLAEEEDIKKLKQLAKEKERSMCAEIRLMIKEYLADSTLKNHGIN